MAFKQSDDRRLKLTKRKFGIFYFQVKIEQLTQWSINVIIHWATKLQVTVSIWFLDNEGSYINVRTSHTSKHLLDKRIFSSKNNLHPEEEFPVITIKLQYVNPSRCLINLRNQELESL